MNRLDLSSALQEEPMPRMLWPALVIVGVLGVMVGVLLGWGLGL
jgi:hypothetical protein